MDVERRQNGIKRRDSRSRRCHESWSTLEFDQAAAIDLRYISNTRLCSSHRRHQNLSLCFRGSALSWYLEEIDDFKRRACRAVRLVDFTDQLALRFKMSIAKAMDRLHTEKYSLDDAAKEREPQQYLQKIALYATASSVVDRHAQLMWAWQNLM